jgi:hypothetical protein
MAHDVLVHYINDSRTLQAEQVLYANDIDNIYYIKGPFQVWLKDNYPCEKVGVVKSGW